MTATFLPYGPDAVLVDVEADRVRAVSHAVASWLSAIGDDPGDVVPAATTVLVRSTGLGRSPERRRQLQTVVGEALDGHADDAGLTATVHVAITYDGEDLHEVARAVGCSVDEVIARHQASPFEVAFCGFAPGFAYLTGLDERLHLPRRATPRVAVPPGSVAIAAGYCGVYPRTSPGGWHLIGHTTQVMWDTSRQRPALLYPGDRVQFVPAS